MTTRRTKVPASNAEPPSPRRRAAIAAQVRAGIEGSFAHWEAVPELDFPAAFERCIDEMMEARTRLAFGLSIQRLFASLGNGHTSFHDYWWGEGPGRSFGVVLRPLGDRWTVTRSARDELPVGTVITTIDDVPMAQMLAERRAFLCASSDRAAADRLFYNRHLLPDRITLRTDAGSEFTIEKGTHGFQPSPPFSLRFEQGVAMLGILSFDGNAIEGGAISALASLERDAPLVIDLRGNGGGNTPLRLLAALMERPYREWRASVLQTTTLDRAHGRPPTAVTYPAPEHERQSEAHRGPMAIIIDGTVGSAAEGFAMPFQDNGRAVLVGETTEGSSGQPHFFDLGDNMIARVSTKRETFPDGRQFEGIGIAPDIPVALTPEDLAAGRDRQLAAALDAVR